MRPSVVILGAGFAGHTAALHLSEWVKESADVTVVSPRNRFTWFPSLIWVGTGTMPEDEVYFELAPVYEKIGVKYVDGRATVIDTAKRIVTVESETGTTTVSYDFLINATGPYLNFQATPGLGPQHDTTRSVCSVEHAVDARDHYLEIVKDLKAGKKRRLIVGVGHPAATCEGAAFEYLMNVDADLRRRGLRENAELVWLTNEHDPGDFGVDGIEAKKNGRVVTGAAMVRMLLDEAGIKTVLGAGVTKVEGETLTYAQVGADPKSLQYDFAMLIPQFRGIPLRYIDGEANDITEKMTMPNGFMRVDADYEAKPYESYRAADWPALYRSPLFDNIYAAGIAFAPPHPMSKGWKSNDGVPIVAMAPRTGMASGIMGRTVAANIRDQLEGKPPAHHARMSEMPAACIASMGKSLWNGSAASILMIPVARDFEKYPEYGRDLSLCDLDVGLGGAWTKRMLHSVFMWKLQAKPGWQMIPE
ncbi:MAG TPA: FAD-dependent oxidoreductase [Candidatus Aquilonibacter sp.]|nr:FAD-dependent oxidoreductase [Candidatus Aquilonibacter sp.]